MLRWLGYCFYYYISISGMAVDDQEGETSEQDDLDRSGALAVSGGEQMESEQPDPLSGQANADVTLVNI